MNDQQVLYRCDALYCNDYAKQPTNNIKHTSNLRKRYKLSQWRQISVTIFKIPNVVPKKQTKTKSISFSGQYRAGAERRLSGWQEFLQEIAKFADFKSDQIKIWKQGVIVEI